MHNTLLECSSKVGDWFVVGGGSGGDAAATTVVIVTLINRQDTN